MLEERQNAAALDRWESDGGTMLEAFRDISEPPRVGCLPLLPSGYQAQPVWGFRDRTGRFSYEFNRVYGPPNHLDKRGPTCLLDEELSFWSVIWPTFSETGDERPAGRWVSYAQARRLRGSRLTFERFSSFFQMRDELPELLHIGDVGPADLRPAAALSLAPDVSRPMGRAADLEKEFHAYPPRSVPEPARSEAPVEMEEPLHGP